MANKGDIRKSEIQPDFPKKWKAIPFKEGLDKGGKYPKLNSSIYLEVGAYPIIDQGEKFIAGYTNDEGHLYDGELPVIIFGDHTRNVKYIDFEFAVGADGTKILKPKEEIDPRFFYYYLKTLEIPSFGYSRHFKVFEYLDLPLPSLSQQQRIVARLDAVFGHLDVLKEKLDLIPVLLKNFRQQVLTQAVTGELTKEWRVGKDLESSQKLFQQIMVRRSEYNKKKISESEVSLRTDLPLYDLPGTWNWADLEFLMDEDDSFCYGVVQPGNTVQEGQKLIRVMDLNKGSVLVDQLRNISWDIDKNYKRSKVKAGDLLVSVVGTIGRTAIINSETEGFNIARAVAKVPVKDINVKYLDIFLNSSYGQKWLVGDAREVARKTLNLNQLSTLPVPIPSNDEQNEIVSRVDGIFGLSDKIESQYQSLKAKIDQLPQAILATAFRGELINDE